MGRSSERSLFSSPTGVALRHSSLSRRIETSSRESHTRLQSGLHSTDMGPDTFVMRDFLPDSYLSCCLDMSAEAHLRPSVDVALTKLDLRHCIGVLPQAERAPQRITSM